MKENRSSPFPSIALRVFLLELGGLALLFGVVSASLWFFAGEPLRFYTTDPNAFARALWIGAALSIALFAVIALYLARVWTNRINALNDATQRLVSGDLSTAIDTSREQELASIATNLNQLREFWRNAFEVWNVEKNRYAAVIEAVGVAVVVTDMQQTIVTLNAAAENLLRLPRANLLGMPWHQVFASTHNPDNSLAPFWDMDTETNGNKNPTIRGRFPLQAQPQYVLDVVSTPVSQNGTALGYVHILKNASEVEQRTREKDEFLLSIAHELRGPLAAQRASIELLLQDYAILNKRDLGGMIRILHRSVLNFQGLVENLVDIGRLRAGRFTVVPVVTPLGRLVQDAAIQMEPLLKANGQALETQIRTQPDCMILADRARILQVILNLLRNANKYGPEDQPVTLRTFIEGEFAFVEVTDRGVGISPNEQAGLFQRFYRVKRTEEEGVGIGLGLALAKGIVEAHGGQIGLRSQVGEGSTFWFSVPLAHTPEQIEQTNVA